jgi:hypothetical protein
MLFGAFIFVSGGSDMIKFLSHPRFLAVYSGTLTVVFALTTGASLWNHSLPPVHAEPRNSEDRVLDQLTVHRINIVEPDGTPRLVISDKARFPGGFFMGKEFDRADRRSAGMLFMNDEGTENGGMLFGGYKSADGKFHSYGHLSFDEYEQDQSLSFDTDQDGDELSTAYAINDNVGDTLLTPEVVAAYGAMERMPDGPEKEKAAAALRSKYPFRLPHRASLERDKDSSVALRLRDTEGHTRILLRVAADGSPSLQALDPAGKVVHQWPEIVVGDGKK